MNTRTDQELTRLLLDMAERGEDRPADDSEAGKALVRLGLVFDNAPPFEPNVFD
jgi:hypothetical protein